jgi:magnesium transporter
MMMEQQQQHHHQETRRQRGGSMSDEPPVPPLIDQLALSRAILNAPPVGIPERATNEAFIGPGSGSGIGSGGRAWGASERGRPSTNTNINNAVSNVTYRERLGAYLNFRDIRKIVTPFSASNEPEIIVRRHVCLINFDPLRAIILRDRCCVIVPDGADSILVELEKRIHGTDMYGSDEGDGDRVDDKDTSNKNKQGTTSSSSSKTRDDITQRDTDESFGGENISNDENHNSGNGSAAGTGTGVDDGDGNDEEDDPFAVLFDEWDELEKEDWIELPFELKCVDAVLSSSSDILGEDVLDLQMAANNMIIEMLEPRSDVGDRAQELLRVMKNSTRELISRVAGFNRAIDTTLEDSEDMALMNLGRLITHPARFIQPVPQAVLDEESDEPELILEAHLQRGHTLANALNLVDYQVKGIEDFAERKMDNIRNHILVSYNTRSDLTNSSLVAQYDAHHFCRSFSIVRSPST